MTKSPAEYWYNRRNRYWYAVLIDGRQIGTAATKRQIKALILAQGYRPVGAWTFGSY